MKMRSIVFMKYVCQTTVLQVTSATYFIYLIIKMFQNPHKKNISYREMYRYKGEITLLGAGVKRATQRHYMKNEERGHKSRTFRENICNCLYFRIM